MAAVVPVLDEAEAIGPLVGGLRRGGACCVLVVDGGSRDGTAAIAEAAGARVIDEPRRGYGRACLTGAQEALHGSCTHDAVAFLDGDGSCDPADLTELTAALRGADAVLGRRAAADVEPGALPWHARLGNRLVAALLTVRSGRRVRDLPPFKVLRRAALERLLLDDPGYGWTVQLVARLLMAPDLRTVERRARFRRRAGGRSKVSGDLSASARAGIAMLAGAWRETRARPAFVLVAKAPIPGQVKTRLVPSIGADAAAALWSASLGDTAAVLREAAHTTRGALIAVVPRDDHVDPVRARIDPGWRVVVQRRGGLAGAIVDGMAAALRSRAATCVVVSGDNPDLPPSHLVAAVDRLHTAPSVLGPTLDGGYHLIGLRLGAGALRSRAGARRLRRLERALARVRMGDRSAIARTASGLEAHGLPPATSPTWPDLDTAADLDDLAHRLDAAPADVAPRTRAWLAERAAPVA